MSSVNDQEFCNLITLLFKGGHDVSSAHVCTQIINGILTYSQWRVSNTAVVVVSLF